MKVLYYIIVIAALSLPAKGISQNNQSTTSLLVGTWRFDYDESFKKVEASTRAFLDTVVSTHRTNIENVYRNRKVTFGAGGSFIQVLADSRKSTGNWVLDKSKNKIIITDPSGNKYIQKIKNISELQLILKQENTGGSKMLFPEWHFIKIKN